METSCCRPTKVRGLATPRLPCWLATAPLLLVALAAVGLLLARPALAGKTQTVVLIVSDGVRTLKDESFL